MNGEVRVDQFRALSHADQTEVTLLGQRIRPIGQLEPAPIIADEDRQLIAVVQFDIDVLRLRMFHDIVQRLLHDAIKGQFAFRGEPLNLSSDGQRGVELSGFVQ